MTLVARASKTVRLKNLAIVVMCLVFCGWFLRDGFIKYPEGNDAVVRQILDKPDASDAIKSRAMKWTHWNDETPESRQAMYDELRKETGSEAGKVARLFKQPFDVEFQQWLAWGLVGCVGASIWWFIHCQRRRAIAEEATVSPAPGVVIPWEKITRVDNTRWKRIGIVDITYTDDKGAAQQADFDDYKLEREPLLAILDQLAEKAVNAEFVPKEEPQKAEAAPPSPDTPPA
jgi:hypothetical protein